MQQQSAIGSARTMDKQSRRRHTGRGAPRLHPRVRDTPSPRRRRRRGTHWRCVAAMPPPPAAMPIRRSVAVTRARIGPARTGMTRMRFGSAPRERLRSEPAVRVGARLGSGLQLPVPHRPGAAASMEAPARRLPRRVSSIRQSDSESHKHTVGERRAAGPTALRLPSRMAPTCAWPGWPALPAAAARSRTRRPGRRGRSLCRTANCHPYGRPSS